MDACTHEESISMTGLPEFDWLAQVRAGRADRTAFRTPACLDDDTVAALAEGTLDAEPRAGALAHLAQCDHCRRAVASVVRALASPDVAREARVAERGTRRAVHRVGWVAFGTAAAAAVLLLVWPPPSNEPPPTHRAAPITAAPAPEAITPVGPVAEMRGLRWTPVSGADRYRVTVFDAEGSVLFETELTGTATTLPDSVGLAAGVTYWWKVDARLGFDRWAASPLIEFSIGGPSRR